mgnify:CR=1 FL=1
MNISEITSERIKLEQAILKLIQGFEDRTGAFVYEIESRSVQTIGAEHKKHTISVVCNTAV